LDGVHVDLYLAFGYPDNIVYEPGEEWIQDVPFINGSIRATIHLISGGARLVFHNGSYFVVYKEDDHGVFNLASREVDSTRTGFLPKVIVKDTYIPDQLAVAAGDAGLFAVTVQAGVVPGFFRFNGTTGWDVLDTDALEHADNNTIVAGADPKGNVLAVYYAEHGHAACALFEVSHGDHIDPCGIPPVYGPSMAIASIAEGSFILIANEGGVIKSATTSDSGATWSAAQTVVSDGVSPDSSVSIIRSVDTRLGEASWVVSYINLAGAVQWKRAVQVSPTTANWNAIPASTFFTATAANGKNFSEQAMASFGGMNYGVVGLSFTDNKISYRGCFESVPTEAPTLSPTVASSLRSSAVELRASSLLVALAVVYGVAMLM